MIETKAKELLEKEVETQIGNLSHIAPGSDEMTTAVENVNKLYKLKLEDERLREEAKEKNPDLQTVPTRFCFYQIGLCI